jgi:hypothetical protein
MNCFNDAQIQSIVDGEAVVGDKAGEAVVGDKAGEAVVVDKAGEGGERVRAHLASCARCQMRVRERETVMRTLREAMSLPAELPHDVSLRVERALADGSTPGATRLRETHVPRWSWQRSIWSAGAVAAATLLAVVFVAPIVKGPATVSAAEILAKSATLLAAQASTGVEVLEYELVLDGVPREMMPDHADGVYRVKQIIDHDANGRYVVATHGPGGQLLSSVAQDPTTRRRVVAILVDDQPYRFEFNVPASVTLTLPEMERLHMQASVAMMQASGDQQLHVIDTPDGRQYRIQVPQISGQTSTAMWDLTAAEVVVDANDHHIVEFAVKGTFLKQPYSVSYRLISRTLGARVAADAFEVPRDPRAIEIEGEGSAIPGRDVLVASLRELARLKTQREGR